VSGNSVLFQVFSRVFGPEPYIGIGGEVEYHVSTGESPEQRREVQQIVFYKSKRGTAEGLVKKPSLARGEVVDAGDAVTLRKEPIDKVTTDKARATRDDNMH
jgi:hypothetical protein